MDFLISVIAVFCFLAYFILSVLYQRILKTYLSERNFTQDVEPYTLIVIAKNEGYRLLTLITKLKEQVHPPSMVIVVLDDTTDQSIELLEALSHQQLLVIHSTGGKKNGLQLAINAAQTEALLFTDADCIPASMHWAMLMISSLKGHDAVVGYAAYKPDSSLLNKLIQWETAQSMLNGLLLHHWGMSYFATGRNFAYRRSTFMRVNGFDGIDHFQGGDDDLLFQKFKSLKLIVRYELTKEAHTLSEPKSHFIDWLKQKKRHQYSGKFYPSNVIVMLWLIGGIIPVGFLGSVIIGVMGYLWLSAILLLTFFVLGVFIGMSASRIFFDRKLIWYVPAFEIILPIVKAYLSVQVALKSKVSWS